MRSMAEAFVLEVQERKTSGTNAAKQIRKKGLVPAVIYGHGERTDSLSVPGDTLHKAISQGVRIFDVTDNGTAQKALLREAQWDPIGHDAMQAALYRVSADHEVTVEVRV